MSEITFPPVVAHTPDLRHAAFFSFHPHADGTLKAFGGGLFNHVTGDFIPTRPAVWRAPLDEAPSTAFLPYDLVMSLLDFLHKHVGNKKGSLTIIVGKEADIAMLRAAFAELNSLAQRLNYATDTVVKDRYTKWLTTIGHICFTTMAQQMAFETGMPEERIRMGWKSHWPGPSAFPFQEALEMAFTFYRVRKELRTQPAS